MQDTTQKPFSFCTVGAVAGDALLRVMTLAGALAFGSAGPVLGATCSASSAGLGNVADMMASEGLSLIVDDCDAAPGLAEVMSQDGDALPTWVQKSWPGDAPALSAKAHKTTSEIEKTISTPIMWNEWRIETPNMEQPVGFGLLHPGAKPAMMPNRAQNLELRLYMPY